MRGQLRAVNGYDLELRVCHLRQAMFRLWYRVIPTVATGGIDGTTVGAQEEWYAFSSHVLHQGHHEV